MPTRRSDVADEFDETTRRVRRDDAPVPRRGDDRRAYGPRTPRATDELTATTDGRCRPRCAAALEAVLLVVDEPVAEVALAQVLERPTDEVAPGAARAGRGVRRAPGAASSCARSPAAGGSTPGPSCAPYVERFVLDGQQARLTQAALETLAVVAYRQPVTRARVAAVRGVNVDGVMRTLVARGLVRGRHRAESGALLYRTTPYFLERLGLAVLDELPPLR